MVRSTAIAAAKQAYRLWTTRGLIVPNVTIQDFGSEWYFHIVLPGWEITLNSEGVTDSVMKKGN